MDQDLATKCFRHVAPDLGINEDVGGGIVTPFVLHGKVVTGFQRGSKELGFPTANLDFECDEARDRSKLLKHGVYFGFAKVLGEVHMMAMSVGDNPHYKNKEVTIEAHILHTFPEDFYGEYLTCVVAGYIRPMTPFESLDALIAAIEGDCEYTRQRLSSAPLSDLKKLLESLGAGAPP
eukprot:Rhum_TRINITY_DN8252_c0_g1::Rhum_TRINITY_DN8252_c0_g1_i1::g.26929::m.26929/K00861/RFK, FMN1; riboflavin kinase